MSWEKLNNVILDVGWYLSLRNEKRWKEKKEIKYKIVRVKIYNLIIFMVISVIGVEIVFIYYLV